MRMLTDVVVTLYISVTVDGSKAAEHCHVEATDCSVESPATFSMEIQRANVAQFACSFVIDTDVYVTKYFFTKLRGLDPLHQPLDTASL